MTSDMAPVISFYFWVQFAQNYALNIQLPKYILSQQVTLAFTYTTHNHDQSYKLTKDIWSIDYL